VRRRDEWAAGGEPTFGDADVKGIAQRRASVG
jgi:hypothetical protein